MSRLTDGVIKHQLDNGLTVLIKADPSSPVVALYTYVKVGYFHEPDRLAGISHLIEHMFFKGTRQRGVGQIAAETKMLGGYLNASTIYDHTLYYTVLPSDKYAEGLEIQADALINSIFAEDELQKETEVVIQEAKRKLDMPSSVTREKLFATAFTKHRIRRWRIGTEEGLRALTRDDFISFYQDTYRPENIILSIVGNIEADSVMHEVKKCYGKFERGELQKDSSPEEPPQTQFRSDQKKADIVQPHLALGFHTPDILHKDTYALEILGFILAEGRSSRMYQNIKEKAELVNTVTGYNYTLPTLGIFVVEATTEENKLRAAEQAIMQELRRFSAEPVSDAELTKARNQIEADYIFSMESASGQAGLLASYEAISDYRLLEEYLTTLYSVRADDIQRVAAKYLHADNCSLFEYIPRNSTLEPLKETERQNLFPGHKTEPTRRAQQSKLPAIELGSFKPQISDSEQLQSFKLDSGGRLLVKPVRKLPVVAAGVFIKGGRLNESEQNSGITSLMTRAAMRGTQNHSAAQLAIAIENLGSSITYTAEPDYIACTMTTLSEHFATSWQLVTDILARPAFEVEELRRTKQEAISQIKQLRDDMFRQPLKLYYANLFGDHPYGLPGLGAEASIDQVDDATMHSWHRTTVSHDNILVVIVGDCDIARTKELVSSGLAALPKDRGLELPSPWTFKKQGTFDRETRDKQQSGMFLGFPGPISTDQDYFTLTLLQNIVSGLGGRFFEELRGRQGLAYTVSSYLVSRLLGGTFFSYIATSPENEERAREGLLKEFEKLTKELVSEEEFDRSVQFTIGTHKIGLETSAAQMYNLAHHEMLKRGHDIADTFPAHIRRVTREDILAACRNYFDPEKCVEGIVRGTGG